MPQYQSPPSSIFVNLTKCNDLLDSVLNNFNPVEVKNMTDHDINEINQVLMNIQGALKYVDSKTSRNFLS